MGKSESLAAFPSPGRLVPGRPTAVPVVVSLFHRCFQPHLQQPQHAAIADPTGTTISSFFALVCSAVCNLPRGRWAVGRPIPTVSLYPAAAAFPILVQGRRPHWSFRGLKSVHWLLRPVGSLHRLKRHICLEGSDEFVSSLRRFDSHRLERPRCRVGFAPTED